MGLTLPEFIAAIVVPILCLSAIAWCVKMYCYRQIAIAAGTAARPVQNPNQVALLMQEPQPTRPAAAGMPGQARPAGMTYCTGCGAACVPGKAFCAECGAAVR